MTFDIPADLEPFVQRLIAERWFLTDHPLTGEARLGFGVAGCRSVSAGAYAIFFRPTKTGVEIARLLHGSRDLGTL